ncbi:hypothetical protein HDU93_004433 [Gonapodya sp. JEL0774]|nr:hypothetical protein HDU93_004433 [Gonapodya sp. JEL0774]
MESGELLEPGELIDEVQPSEVFASLPGKPAERTNLQSEFISSAKRFLSTTTGKATYNNAKREEEIKFLSNDGTIRFRAKKKFLVDKLALLEGDGELASNPRDGSTSESLEPHGKNPDDSTHQVSVGTQFGEDLKSEQLDAAFLEYKEASEEVWEQLPGSAILQLDKKCMRILYEDSDDATDIFRTILFEVLAMNPDLLNERELPEILKGYPWMLDPSPLKKLEDIYDLDLLPVLNIMGLEKVSIALFGLMFPSQSSRGEIMSADQFVGPTGTLDKAYSRFKFFRNKIHAHGRKLIPELTAISCLILESAMVCMIEAFEFGKFGVSEEEWEDLEVRRTRLRKRMADDVANAYELAGRVGGPASFAFGVAAKELRRISQEETNQAPSAIYMRLRSYWSFPRTRRAAGSVDNGIARTTYTLPKTISSDLGPSLILGLIGVKDSLKKLQVAQEKQTDRISKLDRRVKDDSKPRSKKRKLMQWEDKEDVTIVFRGPDISVSAAEEFTGVMRTLFEDHQITVKFCPRLTGDVRVLVGATCAVSQSMVAAIRLMSKDTAGCDLKNVTVIVEKGEDGEEGEEGERRTVEAEKKKHKR